MGNETWTSCMLGKSSATKITLFSSQRFQGEEQTYESSFPQDLLKRPLFLFSIWNKPIKDQLEPRLNV
jgi:hypothetical protein